MAGLCLSKFGPIAGRSVLQLWQLHFTDVKLLCRALVRVSMV
jgi:hypothetical protein